MQTGEKQIQRMSDAGSDDDQLAELESLWMSYVAAFESAFASGDLKFDRLAHRIEDVERWVAVTPALTDFGIAVKLRIILTYEAEESEKRHWFPLLQSALADLDRAAAKRSVGRPRRNKPA